MRPKVWLGDDGILRIDHGVDPDLSLEMVKDAYEQHRALTTEPRPVILLASGHPRVHGEAKDFVRTPEVCALVTAIAYVADTWYIRYLVDLFLTFDRPPYPAYVCKSETEAAAWLKRFLPVDGAVAAGSEGRR